MAQQPNYVAKCSAWSAVTFWRVVLSILIIPFIIMIVDIVVQKNKVIEFYDDYVVQKSGVFSKSTKRSAFMGVMGVSIQQSWWQRICGYGDVVVDTLGKWDISTKDISNPEGLQEYLESRFVKQGQTTSVISN